MYDVGSGLIYQFLRIQAERAPDAVALIHKERRFNYGELWSSVDRVARGLIHLGLGAAERVAVYLPKIPQAVFGLFGAAGAGGVFVPVNPLLKPNQVAYILKDCGVRILFTSSNRLQLLAGVLKECHDLRFVILADPASSFKEQIPQQVVPWEQCATELGTRTFHRRIDTDMASILYTSGSTGQPKGVILSHRNMVIGAESVATYLENSPDDRLLAVLPFSFDYGLSQLTTAFCVGASVALMDYLLPRDVIRGVERYAITGLAAVPPLWNQLAHLDWPVEAAATLRYITNSGGAMPIATTDRLRQSLPHTRVFLMYGLTEAFRSTYLPPDQIGQRPDSMGKAIPNAEVLVVREDGSECVPGEPGELVHRGSLVAMGYWDDPTKTAERFKPAPGQPKEVPINEIAVWSGDQVRKDEEGYLYFIGRKDEMIKTSGYRVSPTEIEEVLYASGMVEEVAALGVPHPTLGQGILLVAAPSQHVDKDALLGQCQKELPNFMLPQAIVFLDQLPRNQNGKIDRKTLANDYQDIFSSD